MGSTLFFSAYNTATSSELWKSNGTAAGTTLVKDIYPGPDSSEPSELTAVGNTLFFAAYNTSSGYELWKSDGTVAGTTLVKDINPGPDDSDVYELTAVGSTLFFAAYNRIQWSTSYGSRTARSPAPPW